MRDKARVLWLSLDLIDKVKIVPFKLNKRIVIGNVGSVARLSMSCKCCFVYGASVEQMLSTRARYLGHC